MKCIKCMINVLDGKSNQMLNADCIVGGESLCSYHAVKKIKGKEEDVNE